MLKINCDKKSGTSQCEIPISCATQGYDHVTEQHVIIQFLLYSLSGGLVQTFSSKSSRNRF